MGSLWSRTQGRTGIETDSLQTTSSHVDQEPEMTAWDRVFFRCILGIPPLMILLIPNIALPCKNKNLNMTEVMNDFQNVIFQDLQHLLELLATKSNNNNCRKPQKSNPFPCLNGKKNRKNHNRKPKISSIINGKTKCPTKKLLRIKEKISDISLCWKKIFKLTEI
ncbi:uncharacterized protein LOC122549378 isoform X3 [Chiloscyllium plagiosum]|uniref:uncharacterized protein LOC122549378 isoform X3 n=1 Tax=Chiloscyllium plagiosum TaxID=36176 RepID=UPI001CB828C6|nr:uncharacterized protein LOC122549378 isoform X3 [Chiloscyllium plagiosum]